MNLTKANEIMSHFEVDGKLIYAEPFGNGHINTTYMLCYLFDATPTKRYILQQINTTIFQDYQALMNNISLVTNYLKQQIIAAGGDPLRETLTLVPTKEGASYLSHQGEVYRVYPFVEDATCYQLATPALFYQSAKAFGKFAHQLSGFDATQLVDTIPRFHDTQNRYQNFLTSLAKNAAGRADSVCAEIEFVKERAAFTTIVLDEIKAKTIPLRVCHNDTKLNNVMIDNQTNTGLCVIDLDTVMQGSLLYDFGDSIRFGASSALEDEENLDLVCCDLEKYELFVKGYLEECRSIMSETEFSLLAQSAILLTLECGIRFLTDYLDGDLYFKTHKPQHNLIRARNQFKLVADMEAKLSQMIAINQKYNV